MDHIPNPPSGSSGLVETIAKIIRSLREQRVYADPREIRIERSTQGTKLSLVKATKKASGGEGATPRWG